MALKARQPAARAYAQAISELALQQQSSQSVADELRVLQLILDTHPDLETLLASPAISRASKHQLIDRLFRNRLGTLTMNLLGVLTTRRRLALIPEICRESVELENQRLGRIEGTIVTVVELEQQELDALAQQLGQAMNCSVKLKTRVDPTILGGLMLIIGGRIWDGSVKCGLRQFGRKIRNTIERQVPARTR